MTSAQILLLVVIVLVLAVAVVVGWRVQRRRSLQRTFGPEYDRVVANEESRAAGERELRERERRHAELELRALAPAEREQFTQQWRAVQEQFVEDPAGAVVAGDELVTRLVAARGYPTENYEDQVAYLSVEHARPLANYRDAHDIYLRGQRGQASTEDLRQALVHYRALFADLVEADPMASPAGSALDNGGHATAAGGPGTAADRPARAPERSQNGSARRADVAETEENTHA